MNALLTKFALERLQNGRKNEPPSLQQIPAKKLIVIILNIAENINKKDSLLCYCHRFLDCPYTTKSFTLCETSNSNKNVLRYFKGKRTYN